MTDDPYNFEGADPEKVREDLARGAYSGTRAKRAQAWLQKIDRAKSDASAIEQARINKSQNKAMWIGVWASIVLAVITAISLYVSMKAGH